MAWKYKDTASTSGLDGGLAEMQKRNQLEAQREAQNKQIQMQARETSINKNLELWQGITKAGQLSSSDEFNARVKSDFLAPMISQYSDIVAGMNKGRIPVDIGTQALSQLEANLNSYTKFVSYSNDVNQKYGSAIDIEPGKVGAIQTNSNNDLSALQFNQGLWNNPKGYNIVLDEKTNTPIMTDGKGNRININEWNDAMEMGTEFVQTIQDPTKLQETAITNMLGDMQGNGKISITDTRISRPDLDISKVKSTTQSLYNFPAIVENINKLNPFNNLTNDPSVASGYWEGLGHQDVWTGSEDQIRIFNEEMNEQALDKFIPKNQRSTNESFKDLQSIILGDTPKTTGKGGKISKAVFAKDVSPLIDAAIEMKDDIEKLQEFKEFKTKFDGLDSENWFSEYKKIMMQPKFNKLQEEIKAIPGYAEADEYLSQFINQELKIGKDTIMVGDFSIMPTKRGEIGVLFLDEEGIPINKEPFAFKENQLKSMINKFGELKIPVTSGDGYPL